MKKIGFSVALISVISLPCFILAQDSLDLQSSPDTPMEIEPESSMTPENLELDMPSITEAKEVNLDTIPFRDHWRHHPRDPYTAAWMALLIPGMGHFYCGEVGMGLTFIVLESLTVVWFQAEGIGGMIRGYGHPERPLIVFGALKVIEIVTAVNASKKYNKAHGFVFCTSQNGIGLGWAFRF
jgi:hypothetical protein